MTRLLGVAALVTGIVAVGGLHHVVASAQGPTPGSPGPAQGAATTDQVISIRTGDYFYEPNQLVVRPGPVTIELTNSGPRRHTLNVRDAADQADIAQSPRIVAGDTITMTFTLPADGTYAMYCSEPGHLDEGHLGSFTATTAAAGAPAQQPPAPTSVGTKGRQDLSPTLVALWFHVPFITGWIGLVMFDVFGLLAPGLTRRQRAGLVAWSRPFVPVAIVVITVTGIWQTIDNPFREIRSYADLNNMKETTTYGFALFWKHGFVVATFGLTILARFLLAPRLAAVEERSEGNPPVAHLERSLVLTSVANLAACLGAILLATRMVWELH